MKGTEETFERLVRKGKIVGAVVGTVRGDEVECRSFGASGSESVALDGDTLFEIGSTTKTFTGLLLADLVVSGEVRLDDPIRKYLESGVRLPQREGQEITLLHLATHTAGLPRMPDNFRRHPQRPPANLPPLTVSRLIRPRTTIRSAMAAGMETAAATYAAYSADDLYQALAWAKPRSDPGAKSRYSNFGFGILGHILTLVAACDYETLVRKRVCEPLGMLDTAATVPPQLETRRAQGHGPDGQPARPWDLGAGFAGAGALRSTVSDMVRYLHAMLRPDETPLGDAIRLATTRHHGSQRGVGLGWQIASPLTWHNGGTGGFGSYIAFRRDNQSAICALTNSSSSPLGTLDRRAARLLKRSG